MSYDKHEKSKQEYLDKGIIKIEAVHDFTLFPKYPTLLGKGDNTYGIVKWKVAREIEGNVECGWDDVITVCGEYESEIDSEKTYTILAQETVHEKYGKQYQLLFIGEIVDFSKTGNQKGFLQTFLTEGQINELFKVTDNPLKAIDEHNTALLKKAKGVGDYIVHRIIERYEEVKDYSSVYIELSELGLTPKFIQRLIRTYKNPQKVIKIVKKNPYQLTFDVDGIGFKTADKIALRNGMSVKSPERVGAYINNYFTTIADKGHSFVYAGHLQELIFDEENGLGSKKEILEVYKDEEGNVLGTNIGKAIDDLVNSGKLGIEEHEKKSLRKLYLTKYYEMEKNIAGHLKRLALAENKFEFGQWKETIKHQEKEQGWEFTKEQKEAIELTLENQVVFITGGAGTGKTSVLGGVLNALGAMDGKYSFAQCALAGKAAARMQEATGKEGSTIHRLLGFKPSGYFDHNEKNPLLDEIIILDEISLVGGEIFESLIQAIKTGSKLIILGDMGQLESIGSLNLAKDLYDSEFITTCELTKIHRQAQKSGIITSSNSIREGKKIFGDSETGIKVLGELEDMIFDLCADKKEIVDKVFNHFKKEYENNKLVKNIMDIQILSPVKERGDSSVYVLNNLIQAYLNPQDSFKTEVEIVLPSKKTFVLREGDKILNIKNNYDLYNVEDREVEVFNGWVGIVKEINTYKEEVVIHFPIIKQNVLFTFKDVGKSVILGYASTVHKYQGSSAKVIIGVLDYGTPPDMRTRELVYTIPTRAEKLCYFICQTKALNKAINQSGISDKNTFLVNMLLDDSIEPIEITYDDIEIIPTDYLPF